MALFSDAHVDRRCQREGSAGSDFGGGIGIEGGMLAILEIDLLIIQKAR
jgi:hypothetical protein